MHAGPRLLTRRTTLALGAAAIAVTGCDDGDSPAPPTPPAPEPDAALVDDVLVELAHAEQLAHAGGFQDLVLLHRAHIEALDGPETALEPGHATKTAVRRAEVRLQRILAHTSATAESGALARLLASMSAAMSQVLA